MDIWVDYQLETVLFLFDIYKYKYLRLLEFTLQYTVNGLHAQGVSANDFLFFHVRISIESFRVITKYRRKQLLSADTLYLFIK